MSSCCITGSRDELPNSAVQYRQSPVSTAGGYEYYDPCKHAQ